ncbi:MAG TPA: subclass B3 metallo-beta-lactamase [Longimicrobiales bacterium]|nr:subclass B3 metallo-beta-lactamase [Longimicrobiales bacterium]
MFRKKRTWLAMLVGVLVSLAVILYPKWREGSEIGGQKPVQPFRIAGNFYYVGANDISSFLITSPQGHILIDGGYPRTPSLIIASIAKLGFDIKDVKILLNSEPHYDHAGGLATLQRSSGAQLYASELSADVIESGGYDPQVIFPIKLLFWTGVTRYPSPKVDRRLRDGAKIELGGNEVTAYITPGHTRGCTSFSLVVHDKDRDFRVVSACSLNAMGGMKYPDYKTDFAKTFRVLRSLNPDIWVTSHARHWGRWRKFSQLGSARDSVAPFIDREGFRAYVDTGEARITRGVKN